MFLDRARRREPRRARSRPRSSSKGVGGSYHRARAGGRDGDRAQVADCLASAAGARSSSRRSLYSVPLHLFCYHVTKARDALGLGAPRLGGCRVTPELVTVGGLTVDNVISADGTVALAQVGRQRRLFRGRRAAAGGDRVGARQPSRSPPIRATPSTRLDAERRGARRRASADRRRPRALATGSSTTTTGDRAGAAAQPARATSPRPASPADRLTRGAGRGLARAALRAARAAGELELLAVPRRPSAAARAGAGDLSRRARRPPRAEPPGRDARDARRCSARAACRCHCDPGWQLAARTARRDRALPRARSTPSCRARSSCARSSRAPDSRDALAAVADALRGRPSRSSSGRAGSLVWDRAAGRPVAVPAVRIAGARPDGRGRFLLRRLPRRPRRDRRPRAGRRFGAVSASPHRQPFRRRRRPAGRPRRAAAPNSSLPGLAIAFPACRSCQI